MASADKRHHIVVRSQRGIKTDIVQESIGLFDHCLQFRNEVCNVYFLVSYSALL